MLRKLSENLAPDWSEEQLAYAPVIAATLLTDNPAFPIFPENKKMSLLSRLLPEAETKTYAAAAVFFLFTLLFENAVWQTDYLDYYRYVSQTPDGVFVFTCLLYVLVSLGCFFMFVLFCFAATWRYRVLFFAFFAFGIFFESGYQKALGRFSDKTDIETALTATSEQTAHAAFAYFSLVGLIPVVVFLILLLCVKPPAVGRRFRWKNCLPLVALTAAFFIQTSYMDFYFVDRKFPTVALSAFCRTNSDFLVWGSLLNGNLNARQKLDPVPSLPEDFAPANNIVLVIDESVRGDHLSVNGYERPTTPFLEELRDKGLLRNWGVAVSGTTSSHTSYDVLMSGIQPDDLPDRTKARLRTSPTLFQYAKAMRYKTHFLDGQVGHYWGGIKDDLNFLDRFVGVDELSENGRLPVWEIDNRLAREVQRIISSSGGNFIVVFKRGSHIPYRKNYPPEAEIWQPGYEAKSFSEIPGAEQLPAVVNAYDNSLRFNVDSFFQNLAPDYFKLPYDTVIIYTADHGQTLYANGRASHSGASKAEANVPLFIISGNPEIKGDPNFKASHANIFATALDLMNYPEERRKMKYAISLLKAKAADSRPRFYNPGLGGKVPFD